MPQVQKEANMVEDKAAADDVSENIEGNKETSEDGNSSGVWNSIDDAANSEEVSNDNMSDENNNNAGNAEVEKLIAEYEQKLADKQAQLLSAMAEVENIRKRSRREIEDASKFAITNFARDLTSVVDNLYRAADSISDEAKANNQLLKNLSEGVDMTLRELLNVLSRNGVERIYPEGEMFDHNKHQAVVQIEDDEHPAGTILQVMQAGYTIKDRLLRPAMVGVSKPSSGSKPVKKEQSDTETSGNDGGKNISSGENIQHIDTEV